MVSIVSLFLTIFFLTTTNEIPPKALLNSSRRNQTGMKVELLAQFGTTEPSGLRRAISKSALPLRPGKHRPHGNIFSLQSMTKLYSLSK